MVSFFRNRRREEVRPDADSDGSPDGQATGVEALNTLKAFERSHHLDPNLPLDELNEVDNALASDNAEKGLAVEQALVEENSPYPEVRTALSLQLSAKTLTGEDTRFALPSGTTTSTCPPTPSARGRLD
jgi:hypothetical protein